MPLLRCGFGSGQDELDLDGHRTGDDPAAVGQHGVVGDQGDPFTPRAKLLAALDENAATDVALTALGCWLAGNGEGDGAR
jgi:hypothetical protein